MKILLKTQFFFLLFLTINGQRRPPVPKYPTGPNEEPEEDITQYVRRCEKYFISPEQQTQDPFSPPPPVRLSESSDESKYKIFLTKCSVQCGDGKIAFQSVTCENPKSVAEGKKRECKSSEIVEFQDCQGPFICSDDADYGEWSSWSPCSQTCQRGVESLSLQRRVRSSKNEVNVGTTEERPCNLPFCIQECPNYSTKISVSSTDRLNLEASFNIIKAEPFVGRLVMQELQLSQYHKASWLESLPPIQWNSSSLDDIEAGQSLNERVIGGLLLNHTYRTKVKIYNEVWLPEAPNSVYDPLSLIIHECIGQVLDCSTWTCLNGETVLAKDLCDGKMDCSDNSDEDQDLCKGDTGMIFSLVGLFLLAYMICGVIIFWLISIKLRKKENRRDKELEDKVGIEGPIQGLLTSLKNTETFSENDKRELMRIFEIAHQNKPGMELAMFLLFNAKQNLPENLTDEILQTFLEFERSKHGKTEMQSYDDCIKENIEDVEIVHWILQSTSKGCFGRIKTNQKMKSPDGFVKKSKMFFSFLICLAKIGLYLLDIYKDFVTLQILRHISNRILFHQFAEIGNLNLDIIVYYLTAVIILPILATVIRQNKFVRTKKPEEESSNQKYPKIIKMCTVIFPIHFLILEQWYLGNEIDKMKTENVSPNLIRTLKSELKRVKTNHVQIDLMETFLERLPQIVVQLSLFVASSRFSRLKIIFYGILESHLHTTAEVIFGLSTAITFVGVISSISNFKINKWFPATPSMIGSILQLLIIASLLIPKILLLLITFIMAPFAYLPVFLVFEIGLTVLIGFPFFGFKIDFETICSAIVPAFYRVSKDDFSSNKVSTFKNKINRFLRLGGNTGYTILLTVLSAVLVYIPSGFILYVIVFKEETVLDSSLLWLLFHSQMFGLLSFVTLQLAFIRIDRLWWLLIKPTPEKSSNPDEAENKKLLSKPNPEKNRAETDKVL